MGSLLPLDSRCSSFIVKPSDKRPQQTGALARLPVELKRMIVKNIDKPRAKDLKSLSLSSAALFSVIRPLYYRSGSFEDFRQALKTADVARMERNYEFGGIDVSIVWGKKHVKCQCRNKLAKHSKHRPIDLLLFRVLKEEWNPSFANALMWLCSKGFSLQHWPRNHHSISSMSNMMPESLIQLFQRGMGDPDKVKGICDIIQFLSGQSLPIPLRLNPERAPGYAAKERQERAVDWSCLKCGPPLRHVWHETTMTIALRSHCPPIILEVLLQEYTKRGVFLTDLELDTWEAPPALKDWRDAQEPFFKGRPHHEPWFIETDFASVISSLYADLMEPVTGWEEEYQGQTADIWEAKMKLLLRYNAIDEHERDLFQGVLEALRQIAKMSPGTDDAARKYRWSAFRKAIRDFATAPELMSTYLDQDYWSESEFPEETRRPHRFYIDEDINPSFWSIGSAVVRSQD
ncbi:hypothetical protein BFJ72_g11545 [Fusarium proliferatum]|uniref:Uncharacterized protein n=1 Tax=Gibberella intermedia TaxID=948311 RepID=A0A420SMB9_GIBIN|nr:hypothetical protein BFJ72_g11545 [Fusarium proliferatum]